MGEEKAMIVGFDVNTAVLPGRWSLLLFMDQNMNFLFIHSHQFIFVHTTNGTVK